jgi:arylformamidase
MPQLHRRRLHELSQPIHTGMWDYRPLDVPVPPVEVEPITTLDKDGYSIHRFQLNGLSGTYVETAAHMNPKAPLLDAFTPEQLIRPARIMRLPPATEPFRLYTLEDLRAADPGLEEGDALIMATGWSSQRENIPDYVTKGPAFAYETLEWFAAQPFSIWAADATVANCLWAEQQGHPAEVGKDLLGDLYHRRPEMLLVAPLVGLDRIQADRGTLMVFGLPVPGVCAAPARVIFAED